MKTIDNMIRWMSGYHLQGLDGSVDCLCLKWPCVTRYVPNSDGHHRHALPERSAALFPRGSWQGVFNLWQAVCNMIKLDRCSVVLQKFRVTSRKMQEKERPLFQSHWKTILLPFRFSCVELSQITELKSMNLVIAFRACPSTLKQLHASWGYDIGFKS